MELPEKRRKPIRCLGYTGESHTICWCWFYGQIHSLRRIFIMYNIQMMMTNPDQGGKLLAEKVLGKCSDWGRDLGKTKSYPRTRR